MQVMVLPPPDSAETQALDQELSAMKAVLEDLQMRLHAGGYNIAAADAHATFTTSLAADADRVPVAQQNASAKHQMQAPVRRVPVSHPMLCPTEGSLGAIDAMMQARGYRCIHA